MEVCEYKPCDPLSMRLCPTLDERTHIEANTYKAGFDVLVLSEFGEKIKDFHHGVVYRKSSKDKGLMINFCPFCGTDWRPAHSGVDLSKK